MLRNPESCGWAPKLRLRQAPPTGTTDATGVLAEAHALMRDSAELAHGGNGGEHASLKLLINWDADDTTSLQEIFAEMGLHVYENPCNSIPNAAADDESPPNARDATATVTAPAASGKKRSRIAD